MLNPNFNEALKVISKRLNENGIIWAVVGSTNLALQGLDIAPRDIDIIVTIESMVKMKSIFSEYQVLDIEEKISANGGSYFRVVIDMNGLELEILGEKEQGIYAHRLLQGNKIELLVDDVSIYCLTLESELEAYRETGRQNRVEIIEKFLLSQK